jgi:hypothetical protein
MIQRGFDELLGQLHFIAAIEREGIGKGTDLFSLR